MRRLLAVSGVLFLAACTPPPEPEISRNSVPVTCVSAPGCKAVPDTNTRADAYKGQRAVGQLFSSFMRLF